MGRKSIKPAINSSGLEGLMNEGMGNTNANKSAGRQCRLAGQVDRYETPVPFVERAPHAYYKGPNDI